MNTFALTQKVDDSFPIPNVTFIDLELDYTYQPGDPGCWRTSNGDGWPATGPDIDWATRCVRLHFKIDPPIAPTEEEAKQAAKWYDDYLTEYDSELDRIYDAICHLEETKEVDDWDLEYDPEDYYNPGHEDHFGDIA
ncbi:MAG: hypothetical protein DWQ19_08840 [Crenarchaeota archaeon]|nr:MAG: hypothetical protein DWQ19_08840 [Thermoproteota archaeon]